MLPLPPWWGVLVTRWLTPEWCWPGTRIRDWSVSVWAWEDTLDQHSPGVETTLPWPRPLTTISSSMTRIQSMGRCTPALRARKIFHPLGIMMQQYSIFKLKVYYFLFHKVKQNNRNWLKFQLSYSNSLPGRINFVQGNSVTASTTLKVHIEVPETSTASSMTSTKATSPSTPIPKDFSSKILEQSKEKKIPTILLTRSNNADEQILPTYILVLICVLSLLLLLSLILVIVFRRNKNKLFSSHSGAGDCAYKPGPTFQTSEIDATTTTVHKTSEAALMRKLEPKVSCWANILISDISHFQESPSASSSSVTLSKYSPTPGSCVLYLDTSPLDTPV